MAARTTGALCFVCAGSGLGGLNANATALPPALDPERLATSRQFEILALRAALSSAAAASTARAFQSVPRHLRRRAASHDVRRLPLRLRARAAVEIDAPKPSNARKKRPLPSPGNAKRLTQPQRFAKRQTDKAWLETHLHHAKRMHMTTLYGHRLALTPTAKSFRPAHRAARAGSILHDASYWGVLELRGRERALTAVLRRVCAPGAGEPGAVRFLSGSRAWEGLACEAGQWPRGALGPVQVLWRPVGVGVGGELLAEGHQPPKVQDDARARTLWIRVHPACFPAFLLALQRACSAVLDAHRQEQQLVVPAPGAVARGAEGAGAPASRRTSGSREEEEEEEEEETLEIQDLRGQVLAFDLIGPRSTQVLRGALRVVKGELARAAFKEVWDELQALASPGEVPRGMILGFTVYDPRLSYPPKNARHPPGPARPFTHFPSSHLAASALWDAAERPAPGFRKQALDARRARQLVPGTPLRAGAGDGRVPVLLVQKTVGAGAGAGEALHGWTLLFPKGWGMAFLPSLLSSGTLLAGQREIGAQALDASLPHYPRDWVATPAGRAEWRAWEAEEGERWARRPRGKRVGADGCWAADWPGALGFPRGEAGEQGAQERAGETLGTEREETAPVRPEPAGPLEPWTLRLPDLPALFRALLRPASPATAASLLHAHLRALRAKRGLTPGLPPPESLLQSALVHVRLTPCARGSPGDLASIYLLSTEEAGRWRAALQRSAVERRSEDGEMERLGAAVPEERTRMGYVTSGNFSMQRGAGHGLGAVSLRKFLELARRQDGTSEGGGRGKWLCKFRQREGGVCWAATLELVP
ncbi:POP1-domain-containing protein [Calocera cornea HHB12733]|uniref:POP1-domain-containing protein n=1 Tax=Calocera cornea HHB12733 TaxID=1353952 RepID=A0A165I502_9BASI|nr:POP1-domain-containing protein [Calocera cornea HHB12733]